MNGFGLKLDWAEEHLRRLDCEVGAWITNVPYRIVDEPDPEPSPEQLRCRGHHRRFRVAHVQPVPDAFALATGDCVHNARSSLDHLALALGQANTRRQHQTMTEVEIQRSEFPIFFKRPMNADEEQRKIGCIDPVAQAIIRNLQPHLRKGGYRDDPMWQIHELDRIDKHRRLLLCVCCNASDELPEGGVGFRKGDDWNIADVPCMKVTAGEVRVDAIFCHYTAIPTDPSREVKMEPLLPVQVTFGKGEPLEYQPVVPMIRNLFEFIRNTVFAQSAKFV